MGAKIWHCSHILLALLEYSFNEFFDVEHQSEFNVSKSHCEGIFKPLCNV